MATRVAVIADVISDRLALAPGQLKARCGHVISLGAGIF